MCVHNDKQDQQGQNILRNEKVNVCSVVNPFVMKSRMASVKNELRSKDYKSNNFLFVGLWKSTFL